MNKQKGSIDFQGMSYRTLIARIIIITMPITLIIVLNLLYDSRTLNWITLFSGIFYITVAYWWHSDKKDYLKTKSTNFYSPCWRSEIMLLAFVAGTCQIIYASTKLLPDGFLQTKFEEDASTAAGIMAIVITVVTAYYLVTLQGTWSQARELLNKLEGRANEIKILQEEISSINNNADDVFIKIGTFTKKIAYSLSTVESINLKTKEAINSVYKIFDEVLSLYDLAFKINTKQNPFATSINRINEIYSKIEIMNSELNTGDKNELLLYIPTGLLKQLTHYVNSEIEQGLLQAEEIDRAKKTLSDLKDMLDEVEKHQKIRT